MDAHSSSSSPPRTTSPEGELNDAFEFPRGATTSSAVKKSRRQTAFYPNMNASNKPQKPFSRSAAKRESVMALGSIEHLQHYFTKTGLAAKENPLKPSSGLVPAIGTASHRPAIPSLGTVQEFHLPQTPVIANYPRPPFPVIEKTYEVDPEILKPGVIRDLDAVSDAWGLSGPANSNHLSVDKAEEDFDVLATLKLTTHLIRSVRNYVLSLLDDSVIPAAEQPNFRPRTFTPVPVKRSVSNPSSSSEPQARIRRSALDVLTVLRALEETSRLPLSDEAYDAQSDHISSRDTNGSRSPAPSHTPLASEDGDHEHEHAHDVSFAISVVSIPGRPEGVPVWDDEDTYDNVDEDQEGKRDVWDERLVLGGGWLYRQDIRLADLTKEKEAVNKYLDIVDEVLFHGSTPDGKRGWVREQEERERAEREGKTKGRRTSLGRQTIREEASPDRGSDNGVFEASVRDMTISEEAEEDEEDEEGGSIDDQHLPEWAKRSRFTEDALARAHALLTALLPLSLQPLLPTPYTSRNELLTALSSGQLLCVAYNTGVRRSKKPWGYINKDSIHDIAALEARAEADGEGESKEAAEKLKKGWTFRRTDNLRLWAAALKLRYLIPVVTPVSVTNLDSKSANSTPTASPAPTRAKFGAVAEPLLMFDAKAVARKDEGWESLLEAAVLRWVTAVVEEKRGER